jgi:hypothetical protein
MVKCLTKALNPVDSRCEGALLRDSLVLVGSVPSPGRTERVFAPSKGRRVVVDERRRRTPGFVPIALVGASPQHDRVLTGNLALTCDDVWTGGQQNAPAQGAKAIDPTQVRSHESIRSGKHRAPRVAANPSCCCRSAGRRCAF